MSDDSYFWALFQNTFFSPLPVVCCIFMALYMYFILALSTSLQVSSTIQCIACVYCFFFPSQLSVWWNECFFFHCHNQASTLLTRHHRPLWVFAAFSSLLPSFIITINVVVFAFARLSSPFLLPFTHIRRLFFPLALLLQFSYYHCCRSLLILLLVLFFVGFTWLSRIVSPIHVPCVRFARSNSVTNETMINAIIIAIFVVVVVVTAFSLLETSGWNCDLDYFVVYILPLIK